MATITISRELGSLGTYIARETAHRLQIPLLDKIAIERLVLAARRNHPPRGNGHFEEYKIRWDLTDADMIYLYDRVIQTAYQWGSSVMLGRGTFAALQHEPDVLNVRIQAPFSLRVQRVMEKEHLIDQADVETLVKESDRVRSVFIRDWYGKDWDAAASFHLVIDTSVVSPELAVDWIAAWYENQLLDPILSTRDRGDTDIDAGIRTAIFTELDKYKTHRVPVG